MICTLCPRKCAVDRSTVHGFCSCGEKLKVSRAAPHFWEEPPISGTKGSGTVFFSGCNLRCVFCQNQKISQENFGKEITGTQLIKIFDSLIEQGVHNINLVTPTHYSDLIAAVLEKYDSPVPIVYNTSAYETEEQIKRLDGLVDIYLPDMKYYDCAPAAKYSKAPDYFEVASKAVLEMFRQVGTLTLDNNGIAVSGMILRHLVLPGNISQCEKVFNWVKENLPIETHISIMRQYTPYGEAKNISPINRPLSSREYIIAKEKVLSLGFENCYFQKKSSSGEEFIPDFNLLGVDC